jgi:predicted permease
MSASTGPGVPTIYAAFVRVALRPWLSAAERAEVLADLGELRAAYTRQAGRRGLARYTWRQLLQYPWRLARPAQRTPRPIPGSRNQTMDNLFSDFRMAIRTLRRSPLLTVSVVAILALAICTNATIYSVVHAVLITPLPFPEPERLVAVWISNPDGSHSRLAPGTLVDTRELEVFDHLGAFSRVTSTLTPVDGEPEALSGARVTAGYFEALATTPALGRTFEPVHYQRGERSVIVISHDLWTRRFNGEPGILGQIALFDNREYEVIGVMRPGVYPTAATIEATMPLTPGSADFWTPVRFQDEFYGNRRTRILGAIGRLAPEVEFAAAAAAVEARGVVLAETGLLPEGSSLAMTSFRTEAVGSFERALVLLLATVGGVLLIAATNVAALLLTRAESRQAELAVRAALGARRWRLVRLQLVETLVLATAGGVLGLVAAPYLLDVLRRQIPTAIPRIQSAGMDGAVLGFTALVVLAVTAVSGLIPALFATRRGLLGALKQAAATRGIDLGRRRLQSGLVVAQMALAVVLVIASALLVRSFVSLRSVDMGFDQTNVLAVELDAPDRVTGDTPTMLAFWSSVREQIAAIPGVAAVGFGSDSPVERSWIDGFVIESAADGTEADSYQASLRSFAPGYLEALGVPVLAGRGVTADDRKDSTPVAFINAAAAQAYFGGTDPLGQVITIPSLEAIYQGAVVATREIVGVVGDIRHLGPTVAAEPSIYLPLEQFPAYSVAALVREEVNRPDVAASLQARLREIDRTLAVAGVERLPVLVDTFTANERFATILVGAFGVIGLILSALGTYALVARVVALRFREYGLRLAVGAPASALVRDVLATAVRPAAIGAALGTAIAVPASTAMRSQLFEIGPLDPVSYAVAPILLVSVAVVAAALCARRALSVDPVVALRND